VTIFQLDSLSFHFPVTLGVLFPVASARGSLLLIFDEDQVFPRRRLVTILFGTSGPNASSLLAHAPRLFPDASRQPHNMGSPLEVSNRLRTLYQILGVLSGFLGLFSFLATWRGCFQRRSNPFRLPPPLMNLLYSSVPLVTKRNAVGAAPCQPYLLNAISAFPGDLVSPAFDGNEVFSISLENALP